MFGEGNTVLTLLGSLVVIVVVLLLAYLVTRCLASRIMVGTREPRGGHHLTVVEQVAVGKESKLLLVRLEDCYLLLGVTQGSIACLKEFTVEDAAAWLRQEEAPACSTSLPFLEQLRSVLERKKP